MIVTQSESGDAGRFKIDNNGVLSFETAFDFESDVESYTVDISATPTSDGTKSDIECEILVVRLEFVQNSYSVDTVNNVTKDTSVLTVLATYGDAPAESNKVEYSIKDVAEENNFQIDTGTGIISAKQLLTAEDPPTSIMLTVIAKDDDIDAIIAEAEVNVCVGCKTSGSSSPEISLFASMTLVFIVFQM